MPGPWSVTSTKAPTPSRPTRTATSRPPCSSAFPIRLATMRSKRRGSVVRTTSSASMPTRSSHPRARSAAATREPMSTGSGRTGWVPASRREISIRSSTRSRRRFTSSTRSSAGRRASGGMRSMCSPRSEASFTIAVSGVRSSCATSAVKRRSRACASESSVILPSSASAISLKDAAQTPNSSELSTGRRVSRSPSASERAALLARATGASVRLARSAPASAATTTTIPSPIRRMFRSWARSSQSSSSEKKK